MLKFLHVLWYNSAKDYFSLHFSEFSLLLFFFFCPLPFQGVQIPGLGTFTFMRQKLEVGNKKFFLIQRPVFVMAEKLLQMHGLKQNRVYTPGK